MFLSGVCNCWQTTLKKVGFCCICTHSNSHKIISTYSHFQKTYPPISSQINRFQYASRKMHSGNYKHFPYIWILCQISCQAVWLTVLIIADSEIAHHATCPQSISSIVTSNGSGYLSQTKYIQLSHRKRIVKTSLPQIRRQLLALHHQQAKSTATESIVLPMRNVVLPLFFML